MSFYTSGVKSTILEPTFDITNNRTEWRLPADGVYLSNMRICNLALTGSETAYNRLVGAYGVIKSISLLDGNEMLDQLLIANMWMGFKLFNKSNNSSLNVERRLALNAVGYMFDNGSISDQIIEPSVTADNSKETAKSYLSLKDVFSFFRNVDYVSTIYFRSLRIVIEYETNKVNLVTDTSHTDLKTFEDPLLIMDEVVNDAVRKANASFKGVAFLSIESDTAYIPLPTTLPASTAPVVQTENILLKGFDNKYVSRMLICFTPRTEKVLVGKANEVLANGYIGSYASINSKLQLRINGMNKLAGEGITRPNQRLAMLNDTFGNCNAVPGGNDIGMFATTDYFIYGGDDEETRTALQLQYTGTADYHGILVADRIQDLQVAFTRTLQYDEVGSADSGTTQFNDALRMTVFAEVQKAIVPRKGGGFDIRYT